MKSGPCFRYASADASPQRNQSLEVFMAAERVICRSAVVGKSRSDVSASHFIHRVLPLTTLGHGRTDLVNKVHALIHQTWLEYGFDQSSVRAANSDVRQVLTDMGVEFGPADYPDVVQEYFAGELGEHAAQDSLGQTKLTFLYPLALQTPGLLHVLDWVVRHTVEALPFWTGWQSDAKCILQHMHSHNHRERLRGLLLQRTDVEEYRREEVLAGLAITPARFAQWRWKTLMPVVVDLLCMRPALEWAFAGQADATKALAIRDGAVARKIQAAVANPDFWSQTTAIMELTHRVIDFMKWIQGCDCHEADLLAGRQVQCAFKGCRSRSLAKEMHAVLTYVGKQRSEMVPGQYGSIPLEVMHDAFGRAYTGLHTKLHWIQELPYLVWQAAECKKMWCVWLECSDTDFLVSWFLNTVSVGWNSGEYDL